MQSVGALILFSILGAVICAKARVAGGAIVFSLIALVLFVSTPAGSGLPRAVIESAKIDGASHFTTFWRLIVPMSVPALASFAIFQFLWVWNDLLVSLIFLGRGDNTILTVGLQGLQGQTGAGRELIPSAGFITIIVPILVFLSLQRFFIRGMTSGAVKG